MAGTHNYLIPNNPLQHHTTIEIAAQRLPIRQIRSHTPLESGTVTAFPQMGHFVHQHIFQELRLHKTQLKVQADSAGTRRA